MRKKNKRKILILVSLGIFLALGLAELFLRLFYPQVTYVRAELASFPCLEEGERRWIKFIPNKTCILRSVDNAFPEIEVKINSLGLRNREIDKNKQKETKRILFIGDSYTMGWGVAEEDSFPRITERLLNKLAFPFQIETINAGVLATGPASYYIYLKKFGLELKPDVVVVGLFTGNDIYNAYYTQYLETDKEGLPEVIRSKLKFVDEQGKLRLRKVPLKYSIPYLRDSHLFIYLATKIFKLDNILNLTKETAISPAICQFKRECHELDDVKIEIKKLFLAIKKLTQEGNKQLLVVLIPAGYQVYDFIEGDYGMPFLFPKDKTYPNEEFSAFFAQNGIDYLDLLPTFTENRDKQTYFLLDDHWNSTGHQIAAEAISKRLAEVLQEQNR
jgi:lysophospholipase L1-like esterase